MAGCSGTNKVGLHRAAWLLCVALYACSCAPSAPKAKSPAEVRNEQLRRVKWRTATTVGDYERIGSQNPAWDEDAKMALESWATAVSDDGPEQQKDAQRMGSFAESAVAKGCADPLVKYFYAHWAYDSRDHSIGEIAKAYEDAATGLAGSQYHEIRKFFGSLRAAQAWKEAETNSARITRLRQEATAHLQAALADKEMPPPEVQDACFSLLETVHVNPKQFTASYEAIEGPLFKNFAATAAPYAVKGYYYIEYAWFARGGGYADTVTADAMKLFSERLAVAAAAMERGWRVDPANATIPAQMITVEMGQGLGRARMELWFQRAMQAAPRSLTPCENKLRYLYPQWYGSREDMLAFGRECMTNEAWGGPVTAFLVDVHQTIAKMSGEGTNYWKRPDVWPDVHAAFEEFFRRNPEAVRSRNNYAWYARACGAWDVVATQLPLLPEPIDYAYFGGRDAFEAMRQKAQTATK